MAQIFYVTCPACRQRFPCHPELWQVEYELLCPFCGQMFPQEASPLITTGTGEQRPGSAAGTWTAGNDQARPDSSRTSPPRPPEIDAEGTAESM